MQKNFQKKIIFNRWYQREGHETKGVVDKMNVTQLIYHYIWCDLKRCAEKVFSDIPQVSCFEPILNAIQFPKWPKSRRDGYSQGDPICWRVSDLTVTQKKNPKNSQSAFEKWSRPLTKKNYQWKWPYSEVNKSSSNWFKETKWNRTNQLEFSGKWRGKRSCHFRSQQNNAFRTISMKFSRLNISWTLTVESPESITTHYIFT